MAGDLEINSEPDKGSCFTVYLPAVHKKEEKKIRKRVSAKEAPPYPALILIVDDEEDFRDGIGRWLERNGYLVLTAASGREGIKIIKDKKVDLVVLDMIMKGFSGIETFQQMRKVAPDLPFILCSGYALDDKYCRLLDKGRVDFIQKPFEPSRLTGKIREVLDHR